MHVGLLPLSCLAILAAFLATAFAADGVGAASREEAAVCGVLQPGPTRTVSRIIDGETVALDDGTELRLIGALAPRASDAGADPGTWPPEIAAQAELSALVLGRSIELAFGGERSDRHGRLQAQAYWREGERRRWVQGHLLEQGLARAYVQAGNRACARELLEAERVALSAGRGVWADAAYRVRPADAGLELSRRRSTFQVVEGHIERVALVRGTIYLNFGPKRGAFAVSLRRGDRGLLGVHAGEPKGLEGRLVRVRGWIEQRRGPTIDLSSTGLIEVLEEPAAAAGAAPPQSSHRGGRRSDAGKDAQRGDPERQPPGLVETGR